MLYHALSINVNRAHLNIGCDLWWNLWVAVEGGRVEWTLKVAEWSGRSETRIFWVTCSEFQLT